MPLEVMQTASSKLDGNLDRMVRVLIVDDSLATRRVISLALSDEPSLEVVGYAPDGKAALEKIERLNPDIVTLDIEMPVMDGLTTLDQIRKRFPRVRVVMLSSLTQRGGRHTLDALNRGAHDYVTKTVEGKDLSSSIEALRAELVPKLGQFFVRTPAPPAIRPGPEAVRPAPRAELHPEIVAIGVSTGGPNALADVLPHLPADFPAPIVITQHMPPTFTRLLAERLDQSSAIRVLEAAPGLIVEPGMAILAAGGHHLALKRRGTSIVAEFDDGPPEHSCRPAADVMFRSLLDIYGGAVLAVVMTGMGNDGAAGAEMLRQAGASVIAQDRESSVVWGMPGRVVELGLADEVVSLDGLAAAISNRVQRGATKRSNTR